MRIYKNFLYLLVIFIVFHNVQSQDITDGRYGCTWQGGAMVKLICNCNQDAEMILEETSISSTSVSEINISGCRQVKIEANAINDLRNLRILRFNEIQSIYFQSYSINWYGYRENAAQTIEEERFDIRVPSLRISVSNSNISEIASHAFAGRISEIIFDNVIILTIQPLAFVNLFQTEKIVLKNSILMDVGVQSFKKFSTEYFELTNITADLIPSRAISNITVYQNVIIDSCNFKTVRSGGFIIYNPKSFSVINTSINHLNGEAFKIISRGIVAFRTNKFNKVDNGGFRGITLRKDIVLGEYRFIFDSNEIVLLNPHSLSTIEPLVQFRNITLNQICDCSNLDDNIKDSSYYGELMCTNDNELINLQSYKNNACTVLNKYYVIIIVVVIVIILIIAVISGLFMYYRLVYRRQKYGDKKDTKNGTMSLIVPDGRTYRETELHVIVERTDLLTTDL